jgi:hypothetical protein
MKSHQCKTGKHSYTTEEWKHAPLGWHVYVTCMLPRYIQCVVNKADSRSIINTYYVSKIIKFYIKIV